MGSFQRIIAIASLLAAACAPGASTATQSPAAGTASQAASKAPAIDVPAVLKIGVSAALTGPNAANAGIPYANGVILAAEEINAAGGIDGRKIELVIEDHKGDSTQAALIMQKFVSEKVPVVITNYTNVLKAQGPIADANGILLLNAGGLDRSVSDAGKLVYTARTYGDREYTVMAPYMVQLGFKKIALITIDTAGGRTGMDTMKTKLQAAGATVLTTEIYAANVTDFSTYIAKIKAAQPEAVWIFNTADDGSIFLKQARAQGLSVPVFGMDSFGVPRLIELAGPAAEGLTFTIPVNFDTEGDPGLKQFAESYKKKFSSDPIFFSALHYNAMKFVLAPTIKEAISKGYGFVGTGIERALKEHGKYAGLFGDSQFTASRDLLMPMVIVKVQGGKITPVKTVVPAD